LNASPHDGSAQNRSRWPQWLAFAILPRPIKQQQLFVAVWVVLTLTVVTAMMRKIRLARRRR